jgi:hypothetical protein
MKQLIWMFKGALVTLAFCAIISITLVLMSHMQIVRADVVVRLAVPTVTEPVQYLQLTDALPQRDVTAQRFAPLEVTQ